MGTFSMLNEDGKNVFSYINNGTLYERIIYRYYVPFKLQCEQNCKLTV